MTKSGCLVASLLSLFLLSGCGSPTRRGQPLAQGEHTRSAAIALSPRQSVAKNRLAYHVALSPTKLVSVELSTHFELVIRGRPDRDASETQRVYLDTPTYDILDVVLNPDDNSVFVASAAGWVRRYSLEDGRLQSEWRMGSAATALALSGDNQYLLIGSDRGTLCLRRLRDDAQLQCMIAHSGRIGALVAHGDRLFSSSWQGELALWSLPSLTRLDQSARGGSIAALALAPDGKSLAVARNRIPPVRSQAISEREAKNPNIEPASANRIELWSVLGDAFHEAPIKRFTGHRSLITGLGLSATNLISVSWDRSVRLWNTNSGQEVDTMTGFQYLLSDLALSARGAELAIASWAIEADGPAISWVHLWFPEHRSR